MMAFITPQELIDYTVIPLIKERSLELLQKDILEAELEVKAFVGHDFSDSEKYPSIPEEVKLASLKLSQYYALTNSDESIIRGLKSEKIGDYTYQADLMNKPDVTLLLSQFRVGGQKPVGDGTARLRVRSF